MNKMEIMRDLFLLSLPDEKDEELETKLNMMSEKEESVDDEIVQSVL